MPARFGSTGRWWSCGEAVVAGIVPCGAIGVLSRGPCGVRPEPGEGPAFRFVLVSVLRTVSVAVRVIRRLGARGHGHIDDMHRARLS